MKKSYIYMSMALAAVLSACGSKDTPDVPEPTPTGVEVKLLTTTIQTKKAVLEFKANDKMNIYAKTFGRVDAPNIVDDVVASYNGSNWTMEPKVIINDAQKNAFIYAVSPYDPTYVDPQKINVDLSKQVDLMYSGSYVPASLTSPEIKITMKHALSLISFNISAENYSGAGSLTSLALNGDIFYTTGVLDASTGKITQLGGEGAKVSKDFSKTMKAGGFGSDIPGLWALPFNTKAGTVTLTAVIDGKSFDVVLPEVEVKSGWQYIFRLALTNSGLECDPSKTETISLNVTEDNNVSFNGYGRIDIVANGSWINTPLLHGDGVFGTLSTPKGSQSYTSSLKFEGLNSGDHVTLESWNTSGFVIEALDGIETIDISAYE